MSPDSSTLTLGTAEVLLWIELCPTFWVLILSTQAGVSLEIGSLQTESGLVEGTSVRGTSPVAGIFNWTGCTETQIPTGDPWVMMQAETGRMRLQAKEARMSQQTPEAEGKRRTLPWGFRTTQPCQHPDCGLLGPDCGSTNSWPS